MATLTQYPYYKLTIPDEQINYIFRLRNDLDYSNVHLINILGVYCSNRLYKNFSFDKKSFVKRFLHDWADLNNIYTYREETKDIRFFNDLDIIGMPDYIANSNSSSTIKPNSSFTKYKIEDINLNNTNLYIHDYHIYNPVKRRDIKINYLHLDSTLFRKPSNTIPKIKVEHCICMTLINFLLKEETSFRFFILKLYELIGITKSIDDLKPETIEFGGIKSIVDEKIISNRTELIYKFYDNCISKSIKYDVTDSTNCIELTIHKKYEDCYKNQYRDTNLREILYHDIDKKIIKETFDPIIVLPSETITMKSLIKYYTTNKDSKNFISSTTNLLDGDFKNQFILAALDEFKKYSEITAIFSTNDYKDDTYIQKIIKPLCILYYILLKIYLYNKKDIGKVFYIKNPDGYGGKGISIIKNDLKTNQIEFDKLCQVFISIPETPRRDFDEGQKNKVFNKIELILEDMARGTCSIIPFYKFNINEDIERQIMSDSVGETFTTTTETNCISHKFRDMFNLESYLKLNTLPDKYIHKAPVKFRISYIIHVTSTTISSIMPNLIQSEFLLPFRDEELLTKAVYCKDSTKFESNDISISRFISNFQSYDKENTLAHHVVNTGQTHYPKCINSDEFKELHKINICLHEGFKNKYFKDNTPRKKEYIGMYQIDVVKAENVSNIEPDTCNYKVIDINFSGKMLQKDIPNFYLEYLSYSKDPDTFFSDRLFTYETDRNGTNFISKTNFKNSKGINANVSYVKSDFTSLEGGSLNKTKLKNKIKKYQNKIANKIAII